MPKPEVDLTSVTSGNPFIALSIGWQTVSSTSSAGRGRGLRPKTGTITGEISGNASRGVSM